MTIKTGIGQDSHAFEKTPGKPLIMGGITINNKIGLSGIMLRIHWIKTTSILRNNWE